VIFHINPLISLINDSLRRLPTLVGPVLHPHFMRRSRYSQHTGFPMRYTRGEIQFRLKFNAYQETTTEHPFKAVVSRILLISASALASLLSSTHRKYLEVPARNWLNGLQVYPICRLNVVGTFTVSGSLTSSHQHEGYKGRVYTWITKT